MKWLSLHSKEIYEFTPHSICVLEVASVKVRRRLIAIVMSFLMLTSFCTVAAASDSKSDVASIHQITTGSFEMILDPDLQTGVELYTHGESDEFKASHVITGGISSYVNLTWTHIAGTELQLTRLPDVWDFCYFTVSFPWELERVPTDAMFRFSYGVYTDGDFNSTEGELMFNVHSWLIDSSDNWEPLLESEPPYTTTTRLYTYDLNYFKMLRQCPAYKNAKSLRRYRKLSNLTLIKINAVRHVKTP